MYKFSFKLFIVFAVIISSSLFLNCRANNIKVNTNANTTTPTQVANEKDFISVIVTGGRCLYGACRFELIINSDGAYTSTKGREKLEQTAGQIDKNVLMELQTLIEHTDFNQIKSKPFTGTCPTAYDGSEIIYIVKVNNKLETISTCKYAVDTDLPLFAKLNELRASLK